jgi:hypothetical protein
VLARIHRYGEWSEGLHTGWENADEDEITPRAATTAFGLTAISEGLIKVLNNASSIVILKEELEGRIAALTLTKILVHLGLNEPNFKHQVLSLDMSI